MATVAWGVGRDDAPDELAVDGGGGGGRPTWLERVGDAPGPVVALLVAVAYFALAQYVIWLNDPVNAGAGYWPANGITLVALLVTPLRRWGWVLGAVAVTEIAGGAIHDYPVAASGWWAAGNALEPALAAILLRRLADGGRLVPLRNLGWFLVAVVVAPMAGALIGSIGTTSVYGTPSTEVILKWWAGDGLGLLVVAPLLLSFREARVPGRPSIEVAATVAAAVAVPLIAFGNWHPEWDIVLPYLVFPVLMWASVRFGIRGAAIAGFAVAESANLATALGHGPFDLVSGAERHEITVLQIFLGSALTAALVIAALVTDIVDRTRSFERQRSVADALQEAVIPASLPMVRGLSVAAAYVPASSDDVVRVGGDWYDCFPLPDGATAFVIGDVVGHDLDAAVVMGQVRNGIRSLLTELPEPGRVLGILDRQLAATTDTTLVTAVVARYLDGMLTWANAGHPPLLLRRADGTTQYLDARSGRILGIGGASYVDHGVVLWPGDVVVGYTDGVVEDRTQPLEEGLSRLAALVASAGATGPSALCGRILDALPDPLRDDACALVLRRDDAGAAPA